LAPSVYSNSERLFYKDVRTSLNANANYHHFSFQSWGNSVHIRSRGFVKCWDKLRHLFETKTDTKRLMFHNTLYNIKTKDEFSMNDFLFMAKYLTMQLTKIFETINEDEILLY